MKEDTPALEAITEARFRAMVAELLARVESSLDDIETDELDPHRSEGALRMDFEDGDSYVLSQQAPVRELWLAARHQAWHFLYQGDQRAWLERDTGEPLMEVLSKLLSDRLGIPVHLDPGNPA